MKSSLSLVTLSPADYGIIVYVSHIFISHSQRDTDVRDFCTNVFKGTGIKPLLLEYESPHPRPAEHIMELIRQAEAVFINLGPHVAALPQTRTWVAWEAGVAAALDKEIWVFEPISKGVQEVPVPYFRHYVPYALDENWKHYALTEFPCPACRQPMTVSL